MTTASANSATNGESAREATPGVVVDNVCKDYTRGTQTLSVLKDVSFSLGQGEMVAIVGASGVGKSTLLQLLGTLDLPTRGTIKIGGQDVTQLGSQELASFRNRHIGFVFQFHHLLSELTALENAMMPLLIARESKKIAKERALELLERVGLAERLTHRPAELSGGEQQRVALARALVMKPSLLLADEPTGNLDGVTGSGIHELLVELNELHGSTMLVVTHNEDLAGRMPRQLRMNDGGQLVPAGDADEQLLTAETQLDENSEESCAAG